MRKFILSDIHGVGNVYFSIMEYLDDISNNEEIELYINGDLFDRGIDSVEVLLDVEKRMLDNKFKIIYLGGNHELMMYETFQERIKGRGFGPGNWYLNGGRITDLGLEEKLKTRDRILSLVDKIGDLKIYHKFEEKIGGKNIVLVHAACPFEVSDECKIRIKDGEKAEYYVWTREKEAYLPFRCRIGHKNYFTIIGHTPNTNEVGYVYHNDGNYLNIDGGCARYACGFLKCDHVPLVEVCDGFLKILTFNNKDEIIYGNYFADSQSIPYTDSELEKECLILSKAKKLIRD